MTSLAITSKGQITLKRDLLQHMGILPGQRVSVAKLPGGEIRLRSTQPTGSIDGFLGLLHGKTDKIATIKEIDEAIEAGWSGQR